MPDCVLQFETACFFLHTRQQVDFQDLSIYLYTIHTSSVQLRIYSTLHKALLSGLYPNVERSGWNAQGILSVGRYLLRVVDWICSALDIHTIELIDCSTLAVPIPSKKVRLPLLLLMATGTSYYEGSGYVPMMTDTLAVSYYAFEADMRQPLGVCFDPITSRQLLTWIGIKCTDMDLLVGDYAAILLDKIFRAPTPSRLSEILSLLTTKFGYVLKSRTGYVKHLPTSSTIRRHRRLRHVRPYSTRYNLS